MNDKLEVVVSFVLLAAAAVVAVYLGWRTGDWSVLKQTLAVAAFVAFLLVWWRRRQRRSIHIIAILLLAATVPVAVAATPLPATVGVAHEGRVELAAVRYASGAWGTDYLTATHGLRVGGNQITADGRQFDPAEPIVICSGLAHGIDVMLLRVAAHRNRPVMAWGDTSDLKPGDELRVVPHDLPPVTVRLLHHVFEQWADRGTEEWPAEVSHALVAEAWDLRSTPTLSGYSGAPWVRNGRAYGLHKASAKAKPQRGREGERIVALAEPQTRINECLQKMGYSMPR